MPLIIRGEGKAKLRWRFIRVIESGRLRGGGGLA